MHQASNHNGRPFSNYSSLLTSQATDNKAVLFSFRRGVVWIRYKFSSALGNLDSVNNEQRKINNHNIPYELLYNSDHEELLYWLEILYPARAAGLFESWFTLREDFSIAGWKKSR